MIFYDDFERRITHVMCDHCHQDVTAAAQRALKKPLWKRLIWPGVRQDTMWLHGQKSITLFGYDIVLTLFKVRRENRKVVFSNYGEAVDV